MTKTGKKQSKKKTHNSGKRKVRILAYLLIVALIFSAAALMVFYKVVLASNTDFKGHRHIHISTGSDYQAVLQVLEEEGILKNSRSFDWLAKRKKYDQRVLPGRYLLDAGMGNNAIINLLRSGRQDPVKITFNNIRTREQLAGVLSRFIEADSISIMQTLNNREKMNKLGLQPENSALLFIPNTYEFFWNTSADQLIERMHREYTRFWTNERLEKAGRAGLTPIQAGILASIVQRETSKKDEMSRIAGVYINRLRIGMPLQADPTVIYAIGDFSITRLLHRHLAIDSPYNTYKYRGLPPGPISLPEPGVIDRVLDFEKHNYLFFCAKEDFSGYHAFAATYSDHLQNARRYQRALDQRRSN